MIIMARSYQLKRRAERRDETRQKIIEAAIELHQSKGIAATSISDVARRAKVGRVTVYRHFADEIALTGACSGQYFQRNPFPDPETWRIVEDPTNRLRLGLTEIYAYHRQTQAMMSRVYCEVRDHPLIEPYHAHWRHAAQILVDPWPVTDHQREMLHAAISLALDFETWRQLVHVQYLTDDQAVELMERLSCICPPKSR